MYTINKSFTITQEIKKSTFICNIFPITDNVQANEILNNIRKKYNDATHNCYAYVFGDNGQYAKSSDDGEPQSTAGVVILDVLKKSELTNVLAVVTRYFGGIKLGASGLVRAYSSSCAMAVKECEIVKIEKFVNLNITISYNNYNNILGYLKDFELINSSYNESINCIYKVPLDKSLEIKNKLISLTKNQIEISIIE